MQTKEGKRKNERESWRNGGMEEGKKKRKGRENNMSPLFLIYQIKFTNIYKGDSIMTKLSFISGIQGYFLKYLY